MRTQQISLRGYVPSEFFSAFEELNELRLLRVEEVLASRVFLCHCAVCGRRAPGISQLVLHQPAQRLLGEDLLGAAMQVVFFGRFLPLG